jgi:3-oxoacyl-[acyl-carrier protein] reductase
MSSSRFIIIGGNSGIGGALRTRLEESGDVQCLSRSQGGYDFSEDSVNPPEPDTDQGIQGLIYCPGSIRLKPFRSLKTEDYLEDFQVNLLGAVRAIRHYLPSLQKGKGSVLLFSTVAVQTGMAYHASVASSKGAVEGLVRSLAAELAPDVRVNGIAPSLTETPLASALLKSDKQRESSEQRHPLKRIAAAEDIAEAAAMVLKNPFMTGQILQVDGGMSGVR